MLLVAPPSLNPTWGRGQFGDLSIQLTVQAGGWRSHQERRREQAPSCHQQQTLAHFSLFLRVSDYERNMKGNRGLGHHTHVLVVGQSGCQGQEETEDVEQGRHAFLVFPKCTGLTWPAVTGPSSAQTFAKKSEPGT